MPESKDADKKKDKKVGKHNPEKYIDLEPTLEQKMEEKIKEIALGLLDEAAPLNLAQRRQRGKTMRRYARKIQMAKKRAQKRKASKEKLKTRAQKKARDIIRQRLMRNKKYSEMTPAEKMTLDKRMQKISPKAIERIAKKQLPSVRKAEVERLAALRGGKKNEDYSVFDEAKDDPCWDGYQQIGMKKKGNKEVPNCVPEEMEAPRKKRFHKLFTKENKVKVDRRFKMYRKVVNESNLIETLENIHNDLEARSIAFDMKLEDIQKMFDDAVNEWDETISSNPFSYAMETVDISLDEQILIGEIVEAFGTTPSPELLKKINMKAKDRVVNMALDAIEKMTKSKGSKQSIGGYAFDIAKSYNIGMSGRELEKLYRKERMNEGEDCSCEDENVKKK